MWRRGKHHKPRWWRPDRDEEGRRPRRHLSCLVDGDDRQEHLITDEAYQEGLRAGRGAYQVLCGRVVAVASMVTPPGRRCQACQRLEKLIDKP